MEVYIPLFAALIGGAFGAFIGNIVQHQLSLRMTGVLRSRKAKILADSLRGEIKSVRDQLKALRSAGTDAPSTAARNQDECDADGTRLNPDTRFALAVLADIKAPVYQQNVGQIGLLWNLLSKEVVEFHSDLHALTRHARHLPRSSRHMELNGRHDALDMERESLIKEAGVLNERLLGFSKGNPYPMARERRDKCLIVPMPVTPIADGRRDSENSN